MDTMSRSPGKFPVPAGTVKSLVISDCFLKGTLLLWGSILDLDAESTAALARAGRVIECTPAIYGAFREQVRGLLTERESQVIGLADLPDKQIADLLQIAAGTVRKHWHSIFAKLHRNGRTGAALFWQAWTGADTVSRAVA
jgi:DNA-binding CsgD family transcriptional regulator